MRARISAVLTAATIAIPFAAITSPPASAATTWQLTVRVIDRTGQVAASADVQVLNVGRDTGIDLGTGRHRQLRPGTYNVAAWIITGTGAGQTFTLADQVVDLTANKTVVLDARQGHRVRLSLNNPAAQAETLEIAPIVGGHWAFNPTTISPPPGAAYLVPMHSALMQLYVYSVWEKKGNTVAQPSPFRYDVVHVYRGLIPRSPAISTTTSSLTRVDVRVRATDAGQTATLSLSPQPSNGPVPLNATSALGATPAHLVSYRSPGWQWQPIVEWDSPAGTLRDNDLNQPAYGRGAHAELWGAAVWAPAPGALFAGIDGRRLQAGLVASDFPIGDPLHPSDEGSLASKEIRLYSGGTLLAHTGQYQVNVRIPEVSRQYRLTLTARRPAGALLSASISGVWKFMAKGSGSDFGTPAQVYGVQLLPAGLDGHDQVASGSLTRVALRIYSALTSSPVRLATVRAWASADDGTSWRAVSVSWSGGRYVVSVKNASAAGFTSLRIHVGDRQGNSEDLTVIHAYGVR
ncbi:MAG TPA: hypothetical protein VGH96_13325 [Streptosporangiaceae bacterium]